MGQCLLYLRHCPIGPPLPASDGPSHRPVHCRTEPFVDSNNSDTVVRQRETTLMSPRLIVGPVAAITMFDTEDEAVAAANDTEYGLAAYFYAHDLNRAMRVAGALKTGMVGVNRGVISDPAAPFGGVKESGFEREGALEGIEEYLNTKYIAL